MHTRFPNRKAMMLSRSELPVRQRLSGLVFTRTVVLIIIIFVVLYWLVMLFLLATTT